MTAFKQALIYCDGGGEECPYRGECANHADPHDTIVEARTWAKEMGWLHHGGKDFCEVCRGCDSCDEPVFQIVADATKDPVEYKRCCKTHMDPEGPFPVD